MVRLGFEVILISISVLSAPLSQFRVIKEWNYINYTWPNYDAHLQALTQGNYIPQNNLIAGINYYNGFYYLAIPRMKPGIPVTLARISSVNPRPTPLLEPFPSWKLNEHGNCTALQNVQNIAVDSQGKLWIIDGGKTETLSKSPNVTCSPKLIIFDIEKMKILSTHTFPEQIANKSVSFLYDLVIDDSDGGYAYITDNSRLDPGLIVFSLTQNSSWKIRDQSMEADLSAANFKINDETIKVPINIAGIALGPKTNINDQNMTLNEDREVFYCPISSLHLYSVSTFYLKNQAFSVGENFSQYVRDIGAKAAQTDGMKMDNKGILYYGLLSMASIARWDSSTPFSSEQQIISKDENYIQWPNSFAFDDEGNILVLTNSLEKYIQNKMSLREPNFRILMAYVDGKSYVYDDNTLIYSVYETNNENNTHSSAASITSAGYETSTKVEKIQINSRFSTTQKEATNMQETTTLKDTNVNKEENGSHTLLSSNSAVLTTISMYLLAPICIYVLFIN